MKLIRLLFKLQLSFTLQVTVGFKSGKSSNITKVTEVGFIGSTM